MIKGILTTFVYFLCLIMVAAFFYTVGHFNAIDAVNTWIKAEVPIAQPQGDPIKFFRYGGAEAFEKQMKAIQELGKQELVTAWDRERFWPWDALVGAIKDWRE